MPVEKIEFLLRKNIGLDPAAVGQTAILHAVRLRMAAHGLNTVKEYVKHLKAGEKELQELIEEVVVPETWFFREKQAFANLVHFLLKEWLPQNQTGTLRLLSMPCSTGEEPYSMAMAMLDAGLSPERFTVDAVDISERALERAAHAKYGRNSFRSEDMDFRSRHFCATPDGSYQLNENVRSRVRFHRGNLLSSHHGLRPHSYDAVFCRNALIYFDEAAREQAIRILDGLMAPTGLLFTSPAEAFLPVAFGFRSAGYQSTAVFRRAGAGPHGSVEVGPVFVRGKDLRRTRLVPEPRPRQIVTVPAKKSVEPSASIGAERVVELKVAAGLADAGRLAEAAEICAAHLRRHGPSAAAFYLLGLVSDASGDSEEAANCYRRTIYLDPAHVDAMMHLALLVERDGDAAAALRLRERARRAGEVLAQ